MTLVELALGYAARGIKVFPVTAEKMPAWSNEALGLSKGSGGFKVATTDPDEIARLFAHRRAAGVGMPTGAVNDVVVLDLDHYKGGAAGDNARAVYLEYEDSITATTQVRTKNGGLHAYFRYRPGDSKNSLGLGVEIQTDGAFVCAPGAAGYSMTVQVPPEEWPDPPWPCIGATGVKRHLLPPDGILERDAAAERIAVAMERLITGESVNGATNEMAMTLANSMRIPPFAIAHILRAVIRMSERQNHGRRAEDLERFYRDADGLAEFHGRRAVERMCGSACKKDPVSGVIGVQEGPLISMV